MPDISLDDRGRALEDAFFLERDKKLVAEMKAAKEKKEAIAQLKAVSGIADESVLDRLWSMKISAEVVAATALVPLVQVAWADGKLDDKEQSAVIDAALESGLEKGSAAHQLLKNWLNAKPPSGLFEAWEAYTTELCKGLDAASKKKLEDSVIGRARRVAEAAGGFLGLGSKVSAEEEFVLNRLKKAFG